VSAPAKLRLHVNRHVIASNRKRGEREPIYRLKVGRDNVISKTDSIELTGRWRVAYSPDKPLSCGAVAWIECVEGSAIVDPSTVPRPFHYYPKETA
jgi:hypothetical protein